MRKIAGLGKHGVQDAVELLRGGQVMAEGFFDNDAGLGTPGCAAQPDFG